MKGMYGIERTPELIRQAYSLRFYFAIYPASAALRALRLGFYKKGFQPFYCYYKNNKPTIFGQGSLSQTKKDTNYRCRL